MPQIVLLLWHFTSPRPPANEQPDRPKFLNCAGFHKICRNNYFDMQRRQNDLVIVVSVLLWLSKIDNFFFSVSLFLCIYFHKSITKYEWSVFIEVNYSGNHTPNGNPACCGQLAIGIESIDRGIFWRAISQNSPNSDRKFNYMFYN